VTDEKGIEEVASTNSHCIDLYYFLISFFLSKVKTSVILDIY
jgi:hypothetical protein